MENENQEKNTDTTEETESAPQREESFIYPEENREWMREYDDDRLEVDTKKGTFVLRPVSEEKVEKAKRRADKLNGSLQSMLFIEVQTDAKGLKDCDSKKYVREILTDRDFKELDSRVSIRLKYAAMYITGLIDFLE